jgi:hypothetical protein
MNAIKSFEIYFREGLVKKINPDFQRAKNLVIESERKKASLSERIEKIGIKNENANDYVEYCYDIIMLLVRAKMYSEGYSSSGQGAHEAEVSYLKILGFSDNDVNFLDKIRYFRNGMLYYGTILDKEYAEKVVRFMNKLYPILKGMVH